MDLDVGDTSISSPPTKPALTPRCDAKGCKESRKYRLVKDWTRGACGMSHLRVLEGKA
jgi:Ino eighty subunit 2